jgi:hypothetical protein
MTEEIEKRLSKPDSKAGRIQRSCLMLLAEHRRDGAIPTSGRFLFYELVSRRVATRALSYILETNSLLISRSHRTELATATHTSQSVRLRATVPNAGCRNGA